MRTAGKTGLFLCPVFSGVFPFLDVGAVVIEREMVGSTEVLATIMAAERQVDPFPAFHAGSINGVLLLPEDPGEEPADRFPDGHA
jgi:hypothetical protein